MEKASVTAMIMAFHRALEMLVPEGDRVCTDPLALQFLLPDWAALLQQPEQAHAFMEGKHKEFPGVNGAIVGRVRFMDDAASRALEDGIKQVVILGAGFDTRAYRLKGVDDAAVFEVDHPATQKDKLAHVERIFGAMPPHVRFVPLDLSTQNLDQVLEKNGYDPLKPAFFILEGVTPYLPLAVLESILTFISGEKDVANQVVFDYLPPDVVDGTCPWTEAKNMVKEVNAHGEKFRLGFTKNRLEAFLGQYGFEVKENVNAPELKERYFHGTSSGRPVTPVFWFAHAVRAAPPAA